MLERKPNLDQKSPCQRIRGGDHFVYRAIHGPIQGGDIDLAGCSGTHLTDEAFTHKGLEPEGPSGLKHDQGFTRPGHVTLFGQAFHHLSVFRGLYPVITQGNGALFNNIFRAVDPCFRHLKSVPGLSQFGLGLEVDRFRLLQVLFCSRLGFKIFLYPFVGRFGLSISRLDPQDGLLGLFPAGLRRIEALPGLILAGLELATIEYNEGIPFSHRITRPDKDLQDPCRDLGLDGCLGSGAHRSDGLIEFHDFLDLGAAGLSGLDGRYRRALDPARVDFARSQKSSHIDDDKNESHSAQKIGEDPHDSPGGFIHRCPVLLPNILPSDPGHGRSPPGSFPCHRTRPSCGSGTDFRPAPHPGIG